jgi:hypothetical protein
MSSSQSIQSEQYLVHHQGQIQGPFDVDFIEVMIMSGVYPASVIVEKSGTSVRVPFTDVRAQPKPPPVGTFTTSPSKDLTSNGALANQPSKKPRSKKTKPETVAAQVVGVFAVLVVIWIIATVTYSKKPQKSSFSSTSSPASSSHSYTQPTRTSTSAPRSNPVYPSSGATSVPADTMVYRDASGRTYRVSNSDYYRLSSMKSALSIKQSRLNAEEGRLNSLAQEVERARATLDRYSQNSVDAYNRKVAQVNSLNSQVQSLVNDYNRDVINPAIKY